AVGVDERDERHRRAADVRGEEREIVERALGAGVENAIPVQRRQPGGLVMVDGGHVAMSRRARRDYKGRRQKAVYNSARMATAAPDGAGGRPGGTAERNYVPGSLRGRAVSGVLRYTM